MFKRVLISSLLLTPLMIVAPVTSGFARDDASSTTTVITNDADQNTSALITRQQERMGLLESGLRDLRGIVEQDLRQLKMQIEQLSSSASSDESEISADIRTIANQLERLTDSIAMTNRRMERTLEITSDVEFRMLRMEKRMQTLMTLGGADVANAAVRQDTIPAGAAEEVQMNRNANDGSVTWSMNEDVLNDQIAKDNLSAAAGAGDNNSTLAAADNSVSTGGETAADGTVAQTGGRTDVGGVDEAEVVVETPQVLPDLSPEEQYRFALGRALQNDLETAERAFDEFRKFNKGHQREADASFWLGRVQFMRGQYEKAAMTFSEFNSVYPDDARLVDTTMWIAESVSHFAPKEQACAIYASLPKLLDTPPDSFFTRLDALSKAANCDG